MSASAQKCAGVQSKMMRNSDQAASGAWPVIGRPADHRRQRARCAADHDVLRRAPLEPHRVDDRIEEDRERQQAGGQIAGGKAEREHGKQREDDAERRGFLARDAPGRNGARDGAAHQPVDIGVVPHVERARCAGADRDRDQRCNRQHGVMMAGRNHHADERREDDQRHHTRLQQREVIAQRCRGGLLERGDRHDNLPLAGRSKQLACKLFRVRGVAFITTAPVRSSAVHTPLDLPSADRPPRTGEVSGCDVCGSSN